MPQTYAELESLPGVGHKTASVMMSQAFGEPAIAVDTVSDVISTILNIGAHALLLVKLFESYLTAPYFN